MALNALNDFGEIPYLSEWLFSSCEIKGKKASCDVSFSCQQKELLPDWKIRHSRVIPTIKCWKEGAYAESTL